jgi:LPS-assembly protein
MIHPRVTTAFIAFCLASGALVNAQENQMSRVEVLAGAGSFTPDAQFVVLTNDVIVKYEEAVMTADRVAVNLDSGAAVADGKVRIQQGDQVWAGEHVEYNFKTRLMVTQQFRTGKSPLFAEGNGLHGEVGDLTNGVYVATNAFLTTDDVSRPAVRIRAKNIRIIRGERIQATHATLYVGEVPVFYFPYYSRSLRSNANHFNVMPGYRSRFGPFVLGTYSWFWNEHLDGEFHLDYRQKRGIGVGPDMNLHLGRWGEADLRYYYARDQDPSTNATLNAPLMDNRQRVYVSYQASPYTNFNVKSMVRYQNDIGVVHDFFENEYRQDPQPDTFLEVNKFWQNFSLDVLAQPRVNDFYETVERLPDVRLTGFRQQVGPLPLYYQSESSAGYYRRLFAETNGAPGNLDFEASRADTYQEILMPHTFFGWLNIIPRAGGRFTYYSEADGPGSTTDEATRAVFDTGAEVTFKLSRLWPQTESRWLDLDGMRHIVEPSANYMYVAKPNYGPSEIPQFDYELPSLLLLPFEFPEYNSIDSIDSQNVVRLGLRNKLQTKRRAKVDDFLDWEVFADWRLDPRSTQTTFSDAYSDLALKPRTWLSLHSLIRFDIEGADLRMSLHTFTIQPNDVWSWTLGHFYLRDESINEPPTGLGEGNNLITSTILYRLNENWGFRAGHHYQVEEGRMEEQYYTIYRDMRSWTAGLTAGWRENGDSSDDFIVSFTFSIKAFPRFGLSSDSVQPYSLLGR